MMMDAAGQKMMQRSAVRCLLSRAELVCQSIYNQSAVNDGSAVHVVCFERIVSSYCEEVKEMSALLQLIKKNYNHNRPSQCL